MKYGDNELHNDFVYRNKGKYKLTNNDDWIVGIPCCRQHNKPKHFQQVGILKSLRLLIFSISILKVGESNMLNCVWFIQNK